MNNEFSALADEIVRWLFRHKPVAATYAGHHSQDDRFAIFNVEYLKDIVRESTDFRMKLRRLKDNQLSPMEIVHRDLLREALEITEAEVEPMEYHSRAADLYIHEILSGLHILIARDSLPLEERTYAVLGRLRGVWRVLREGMANLRSGRNVPKLWTENAIFITEATLRFYDTVLADFIEKTENDDLRPDLLDAVSTSRSAIEHYLSFLRMDMLASSKGRFAVGKDHFQLLMRRRHHVKMIISDMVALSEELVAREKARIEEFARTIDPEKSWQDILRDARQKPPAQEELLERYQKAIDRARAFSVELGLVAIPSDEELSITWTPGHLRHFHPHSTTLGPPPFEDTPLGYFLVSQVEQNRHEEIRHQQAAGHFAAQMPLAAALLAYPGLHTADVHRQAIGDPLLKFHEAGFFREGWMAYIAELLDEKGYFEDPIERLCYLRFRLLNAYRVQLDVKMHLQEITMEECIELLSDECAFEPANAEREARRYASNPTRQLAFHMGHQQILELREKLEKKRGKSFDLAAFHGELLACGHIPADIAEELMNKDLVESTVKMGSKPKPAKADKQTAKAPSKSAKKPAAKSKAAASNGTGVKSAKASSNGSKSSRASKAKKTAANAAKAKSNKAGAKRSTTSKAKSKAKGAAAKKSGKRAAAKR